MPESKSKSGSLSGFDSDSDPDSDFDLEPARGSRVVSRGGLQMDDQAQNQQVHDTRYRAPVTCQRSQTRQENPTCKGLDRNHGANVEQHKGDNAMRVIRWTIGMVTVLAGMLPQILAADSNDLVVQSFDSSGKIVFNKLTNAVQYRIEWASTPGKEWMGFHGASTSLDAIAISGEGCVTCSVPMCYRVVASLLATPAPMELIPEGNFVMGCATNVFPGEGGDDERPMHTVYVSGFYMDRYEVTKALWDNVKKWSYEHGYEWSGGPGMPDGTAKAPLHPVSSVCWFDAVKWCNARSEKEGLPPVYYTNAEYTAVYRTGDIAPYANWSAKGYRLPTEAEWEKAARGGVADTRFPWTDTTNTISHAKANYNATPWDYTYDTSTSYPPAYSRGSYHPTYTCGGTPFTSPVGAFPANGYGLYDMAGNVCEWCWDWHDGGYYATSPARDPKGPNTFPPGGGTNRVVRSGNWHMDSFGVRVSTRYGWWGHPSAVSSGCGFRCAKSL
jgi:formylglycine-generating enzyme required for sulfatase activity